MSDILSQDLVKDLVEKINTFNKNQINYVEVEQDDAQQISDKKKIKIGLEKLYSSSLRDDYYFFDCPVVVYKNTLNKRFDDFKEFNVDADLIDFIKSEYRNLCNLSVNRVILKENYHTFSDEINAFKITILKKKDFLKKELKKKGVFVSNEQLDDVSPFEDIPLDDEVRFSDKDKPDVLTSNQVVILLDKVGFFSNDKIQRKSQAKQAELISMITGFNVKNTKTYISKLEGKLSELGDNYQKDIDVIDSLLNDI